MHEVQRDLAYTGVVAAGLLIVRRTATSQLLAGVLGGITVDCLYGLGTRVLPDHLGRFDSTSFGYRLSPPITYWNGLGIFGVMGLALALAFALRSRSLVGRALAAAALPFLAACVYFTFSRGAWYALVLGLVATIAVDPRRLQLLAGGAILAIFPALGIADARTKAGLTTV